MFGSMLNGTVPTFVFLSRAKYGRDLVKDLKSETSGNFRDTIMGLMMPLNQYLASQLKTAMKGLGTDEDTLIEVCFLEYIFPRILRGI